MSFLFRRAEPQTENEAEATLPRPALPPIDLEVPATLQTATFAAG